MASSVETLRRVEIAVAAHTNALIRKLCEEAGREDLYCDYEVTINTSVLDSDVADQTDSLRVEQQIEAAFKKRKIPLMDKDSDENVLPTSSVVHARRDVIHMAILPATVELHKSLQAVAEKMNVSNFGCSI